MEIELPDLATTLALPLRFTVGLALLSAAVGKLKNLPAFARGVLQYRILPNWMAKPYAYLLAFAELTIGGLLVLGKWTPQAALGAALILMSFGIAVAVNIARRRVMPCYCFGAGRDSQLGWATFGRIVVLLAFSLGLVLAGERGRLGVVLRGDGLMPVLIGLIPTATLTATGLLLLQFVEVSPLVVRAWTARVVKPEPGRFRLAWSRESDGDGRRGTG